MKSKEWGKNEESKVKVSGGGEDCNRGTIMGLMQTLVDNLGCLEVIVKVLDLIRENIQEDILNDPKFDLMELHNLHSDFPITQPLT